MLCRGLALPIGYWAGNFFACASGKVNLIGLIFFVFPFMNIDAVTIYVGVAFEISHCGELGVTIHMDVQQIVIAIYIL